MIGRLPLIALLLLAALPARAGSCDAPARAAEQAFGLPEGLLAAIGRVESGQRQADGTVAAWPWSVNAAGQGYVLGSAEAAVALVAALQARGVRSIDVGCFQVNLLHHPEAFATLAEAFEPAANAAAAGRFLQSLHMPGEGWDGAIARYHSATPAFGLPYLHQVLASWSGGPAMARPPISQVALLVRVIVPGGGPDRRAGLRLPVVITPARF